MESPEHKLLESDMRRLAELVSRHREQAQDAPLNDREIVRQSLSTLAGTPPAPPQHIGTPQNNSPLPDYAKDDDPETKLETEYLLDLAFHKGLDAAFKEAEKSNDRVKDTFRDTLTGKCYDELKAEGKL